MVLRKMQTSKKGYLTTNAENNKLTPITIPQIAFLGYTKEDDLEFLESRKTVSMPT